MSGATTTALSVRDLSSEPPIDNAPEAPMLWYGRVRDLELKLQAALRENVRLREGLFGTHSTREPREPKPKCNQLRLGAWVTALWIVDRAVDRRKVRCLMHCWWRRAITRALSSALDQAHGALSNQLSRTLQQSGKAIAKQLRFVLEAKLRYIKRCCGVWKANMRESEQKQAIQSTACRQLRVMLRRMVKGLLGVAVDGWRSQMQAQLSVDARMTAGMNQLRLVLRRMVKGLLGVAVDGWRSQMQAQLSVDARIMVGLRYAANIAVAGLFHRAQSLLHVWHATALRSIQWCVASQAEQLLSFQKTLMQSLCFRQMQVLGYVFYWKLNCSLAVSALHAEEMCCVAHEMLINSAMKHIVFSNRHRALTGSILAWQCNFNHSMVKLAEQLTAVNSDLLDALQQISLRAAVFTGRGWTENLARTALSHWRVSAAINA